MTVSSTTVKNSYSGNGSTTQFAYGYKIFADSENKESLSIEHIGKHTVIPESLVRTTAFLEKRKSNFPGK